MTNTRKAILAAGAVLAIGLGGVGIAQAVSGDDGEGGATGPGADGAKAAALKLVPGGLIRGAAEKVINDAWNRVEAAVAEKP